MNQKLLIIVIAIVVLGLGGYLYFSRDSSLDTSIPVTSTLASENTGDNPVPITTNSSVSTDANAGDVAALLKNISSISLNTQVLENPAFLALVDSTLILAPAQTSGRINPFGGGAAATTNTPSPAANNPVQ